MDSSNWMRLLLNGCLLYWLRSLWDLVEGQDHSDAISIFFIILLNSLEKISALLCPIKMKFGMSLRYAFGKFAFEFHEFRICDDVIVTLFKFILPGLLIHLAKLDIDSFLYACDSIFIPVVHNFPMYIHITCSQSI